MKFDDLLKRLWFFDAEVFAHDSLFVFISRETKEEKVFNNCPADEIHSWIQKENPILCGYNCNAYDKFILKAWLSGYSPEEIKKVNDYIIGGGNGWDLDYGYVELPTMWDLFNEINPRKSLKELEGNIRLNITETTIPFDLPDKWNEQQYKEVLYYCEHDVQALFPIFDILMNKYKAKFIISQLGKIDPEFALAQTDANLTAILLKATKKSHDDNFAYVYPKQVDKSKIPKEFLDYIDDIVKHNDLDYKVDAPLLDLGTINFQVGYGGGHAFIKEGTLTYDRGDDLKCE
jgi:hypothetical protein